MQRVLGMGWEEERRVSTSGSRLEVAKANEKHSNLLINSTESNGQEMGEGGGWPGGAREHDASLFGQTRT